MIGILFWILFSTLIYTYIGYTLIMWLLSLIRFGRRKTANTHFLPDVTLVIAAYNEKELIEEKVINGFDQTYPKEKITQLWITDGSNDESHLMLQQYQQVKVLHSAERKGKTAAINRAMNYVTTPLTIYTDANTLLNREAIQQIVNEFNDARTGCVAGEKRVRVLDNDNAVGMGEGSYWKYESWIKNLESRTGSSLAAAGELYAIRTKLFTPLPENVILDDFVLSSKIATNGFNVKYCPGAYALEAPSANINEEEKRKIRIASGAFQTLFQFPEFLNFIKNPFYVFKYISHKVLRWVVVPPGMVLIPLLGLVLLLQHPSSLFYQLFVILSIIFFSLVILGKILQRQKIRYKFIFIPYYIFTMNMAIIKGFFRFLNGKHDVRWEKSKRAL